MATKEITRKNGYCASKHPKATWLRCWRPLGHANGKKDYCNAGLEDWVTPKRYRRAPTR